MKTKFLFYLMLICNIAYSQNPELFNNNWYLDNFIIDGTDVTYTSQNSYVHSVVFQGNNQDAVLVSAYCFSIFGLSINITENQFTYDTFYDDSEYCSFNADDLSIVTTNDDFYFTENNTFNYVVNNVAGNKQLVITNSLNNQAVYYNVNLSAESVGLNNKPMMYPNPVEDVLNLNTDLSVSKISVYSFDGKLIKTFTNNSENKIDVLNLKSGIYFIELRSDEKIVKQKMIKK